MRAVRFSKSCTSPAVRLWRRFVGRRPAAARRRATYRTTVGAAGGDEPAAGEGSTRGGHVIRVAMTPMLRASAGGGSAGRSHLGGSSGSYPPPEDADHRPNEGGDVVRRSLDALPGTSALSLLGGATGGLRSRGMKSVEPTWWGFAEATAYLATRGAPTPEAEPLRPLSPLTRRRLSGGE